MERLRLEGEVGGVELTIKKISIGDNNCSQEKTEYTDLVCESNRTDWPLVAMLVKCFAMFMRGAGGVRVVCLTVLIVTKDGRSIGLNLGNAKGRPQRKGRNKMEKTKKCAQCCCFSRGGVGWGLGNNNNCWRVCIVLGAEAIQGFLILRVSRNNKIINVFVLSPVKIKYTL